MECRQDMGGRWGMPGQVRGEGGDGRKGGDVGGGYGESGGGRGRFNRAGELGKVVVNVGGK